jgi:hypothetical protein
MAVWVYLESSDEPIGLHVTQVMHLEPSIYAVIDRDPRRVWLSIGSCGMNIGLNSASGAIVSDT